MRRVAARKVVLLLCLSGCQPAVGAEDADRTAEQAAPKPPAPAAGSSPQPLAAGEQSTIPAGEVLLGSAPGSAGRDPRWEADLIAERVPAFRIDRLPYPNDPSRPPETGRSRDEAAALCAAAGKRLCSETEWERACKGPEMSEYTTGEPPDLTRCRSTPQRCLSGFGVAALGLLAPEWTASDAPAALAGAQALAVLRGASTERQAAAHRCGVRSAAAPQAGVQQAGSQEYVFRCCQGPAAAPPYPVAPEHEPIRPLELDTDELRAALAAIEPLAAMAKDFAPFDAGAVDDALRRGGRSRDGIALWSFPSSAVAWSPVPGEEVWVLSGQTPQGALIAALYPLPEGRYVHAASTVIAEDDTSVAIGFNPEYREQLVWSTCWNCPGAGGILVYGDDGRIRFAYR